MFSIIPTARDVDISQPWNHSERMDVNDVPPEARQIDVPDEVRDDEYEFESELHMAYLCGSIRVRRVD